MIKMHITYLWWIQCV